ncbi:hypothetical protein I4U23_013049 [Adineta vaga]|nr:hypothetical protein I4U23_013049 [Adineta vaga]
MAIDMFQVLINNIAELDSEIHGIRELIKQGTPMTDDQLDVYDQKLVVREELREQLTAVIAERDRHP